MSWMADALDDIRAEFESAISYLASGRENWLVDPREIIINGENVTINNQVVTMDAQLQTAGPVVLNAVPSSMPADSFMGPGATARRLTYQVAMVDWPFLFPPVRGDVLTDTAALRVIDVVTREDVDAYVISVEAA